MEVGSGKGYNRNAYAGMLCIAWYRAMEASLRVINVWNDFETNRRVSIVCIGRGAMTWAWSSLGRASKRFCNAKLYALRSASRNSRIR